MHQHIVIAFNRGGVKQQILRDHFVHRVSGGVENGVLKADIGEPPHESVPGSDSCARWMLQRYLQITQESIEPSQQPIRLSAVLRAGYRTEYPSFSLRVGYDRLYSVQNIREFLDNVSQRRTVVYGKGLTLEHNLELFEPKAQAMIRLLMNEYGRYRALGSSSYYMGYEPPDY